ASVPCLSFFFFQAEDGIRDFHVTGVQTCALPIYPQVLQVSMGLGLMAQPGEAQGGGETLGRVDGYDECPHTGLGRRDAEGSGDRGLADPSATGDQEGPGHRTASMPSLRLAATSAGVYTPNR